MVCFKLLLVMSLIFCGTGEIASDGPRLDILEKALNGIRNVEKNLTDMIPSFHFYEYDGHPYDFHNGGFDMYNGVSNKVYHINEKVNDVLYDYNLAYGTYFLGVRSDHPLFGLMWIKNVDKQYHTYRVQIEGYPGYGASRGVNSSEGVVTLKSAKVQYKAYHVYSYGIPSICEVYFVMENSFWNSQPPEVFDVMTFSRTGNYLQNAVYISGRPQNVIMGYMLLSNSEGKQVPDDEIKNALQITAESVMTIDSGLRNFTESALLAVEAVTPLIREAVTDWYNYSYTMQEITNGGEDMFGRRGNRIYFHQDLDNPTHLYYNTPYRGGNYQITSRPIHPFIGLMWITNPDGQFHEFVWKVTGYAGRNTGGRIDKYSGNFTTGNIEMKYHVFSLSSIRDHPSICEVHFIAHSKMWNSDVNYKVFAQFGNNPEDLDNTIFINGSAHNVLLGYMLFSKKNGERVIDEEVRNSLIIVSEELNKITKVSEDDLEEVANAIEQVSSNITGSISNWHNYLYDEQFYKISYEARNMYNPWGNMMILAEDLDHASYNRTSYDLYYRYEKAAVKCKMDHPFVALMLIDGFKFDSYSFKVHSHVALTGTEKYIYYNGSMSVYETKVDYFVFQLYGRPQPSICEVYFTLSNSAKWSSIMVDSYLSYNFDPTSIQDNYIYLLGYIKRVFMGYTLLSKYPGNESISEEEIRDVLSLIAQSVTDSIQSSDDFKYCKKEVLDHPDYNNMMMTFPETSRGTLAYTIEECPLNTVNGGKAYGRRMCANDGTWENPSWIDSCEIYIESTTTTITDENTTSGSTSNQPKLILNLILLPSVYLLMR